MPAASTWCDLVVGLDLHLESVPGSPSPIPFPHPFVGVVGEPWGPVLDEVRSTSVTGPPSGARGLVTIEGRPATTTGHRAVMSTGHTLVPPGVAWAAGPTVAPPADAQLSFGSASVQVTGRHAVRSGDAALSCSDPVRLPTALVMPSGPPARVWIGGPSAPDTAAAREPRAQVHPDRWTHPVPPRPAAAFVPRSLLRARDFLPDAACVFVGGSVQVVNGSVSSLRVDHVRQGPIPLRLSRRYRSSRCDRDVGLGYGWTHSLMQRLWLEEGRVVYLNEDGRELEFDTWDLPGRAMRRGDERSDPIQTLTLRARGAGRWELAKPDGLTYELACIPGESQLDAARGLARLTKIHDRSGHAITLHYDERARLCRVYDSTRSPLSFAYGPSGRLVRIEQLDPGGGSSLVVAFTHSNAGDLTEARDAQGQSEAYEYDQHTLVREVGPTGSSACFEYSGWGPLARCSRTWSDPPGHDDVLHYDLQSRRTIVEDASGAPSVYAWGSLGELAAITDPRGNTTRYEYDDTLARTDPSASPRNGDREVGR